MRRLWNRRVLTIVAVSTVGLALALALAVVFLYPHVGAWAIESRVLPKVAARLDRTVQVGSIAVERGRATLTDLVVGGPADRKGSPLAQIDRVEVELDFWASLVGDIRLFSMDVDGLHIAAVRRADGSDNFRDIARKLGGTEGAGTSSGASKSGLGSLRPEIITATDASLSFRDEAGGVRIDVEDIDAVVEPESPLIAAMNDVSIRTGFGPSARAESLRVTADLGDLVGTASVEVRGAAVAAHRAISLSSIAGRIASGTEPGRLMLELTGSYGGATETLWKANGWLEPTRGRGSVDIEADRFTFDRIDSILRDSAVIDYQSTAIGGEIKIDLDDGRVGFVGSFDLSDASVFHPMLAEKPVTDIDIAGSLGGSFDMASRALVIDEADLRIREVDYKLDGFVRMPGGIDPQTKTRREHVHVAAHLVIPPVSCQQMLRGVPPAMASYLQGYRLKGQFDTDLRVEIDWADLQATTLEGRVNIFGCRAIDEPEGENGILRLQESFTHYVELEVDKWMEFLVGEENPDFVPMWDISQYLVNSLMTTEDSRFYRHRGFIPSEFRTALIKNLEAGYFRYGASSITMQTVKNVLLYREKTLSRKLQELFLTWHIENRLDKDRIFEIYLNAIEYGPALYGIGPAARHYFGKHPRDLGPVEAAFFSSILPSPKRRYQQYCDNKLTRWTQKKIARVLKTMHKRERLTDEEYEAAQQIELIFDRTEAPPPRECRRMVKRAIEKARPTNPMKK